MKPARVECLATYGTLGPGRPNQHVLAELQGSWLTGTVRGRLLPDGWGAEMGYPGLVLDDTAAAVSVDIFESSDLATHWDRLDSFEGSGYRRVIATARTEGGPLDVWIYVLAQPGCR